MSVIKLIIFGYPNGVQTFSDALNLCSLRIAISMIAVCILAMIFCAIQYFKTTNKGADDESK